jgi:tRNA-splicing ligase RtcB
MLHSGSRGVGNAMGNHFIELAKKDAEMYQRNLPDRDLAYLEEGSQYFGDYVRGVGWAQKFAKANREVMMQRTIGALRKVVAKPFETHLEAINCHHNYVQKETHFGQEVYLTRKGAVSAKAGELGIIPGSMGAKSFIVRGKGNPESFNSCSHGAGRTMSRTKAKKRFTIEDQIAATQGVECRKDAEVIDEIPMAYKDIDAVMAAQRDLVEVVYTLKQVVCVKG